MTPKIIGRAVKVPGGVTVVAVMIGAALLGVVGALVAIPGRRGTSVAGLRTVVSQAR